MPATMSPAQGVTQKPKLLDQVRYAIRRKHYSIRTEATYVNWIKKYIFFHNKRHPAEMGAHEIELFLNHLAVEKKVYASTHNQALSALVFLYREVLQQRFEWMGKRVRPSILRFAAPARFILSGKIEWFDAWARGLERQSTWAARHD